MVRFKDRNIKIWQGCVVSKRTYDLSGLTRMVGRSGKLGETSYFPDRKSTTIL